LEERILCKDRFKAVTFIEKVTEAKVEEGPAPFPVSFIDTRPAKIRIYRLEIKEI
jgi:hypothetical protein